jgi:hypothetical protein
MAIDNLRYRSIIALAHLCCEHNGPHASTGWLGSLGVSSVFFTSGRSRQRFVGGPPALHLASPRSNRCLPKVAA